MAPRGNAFVEIVEPFTKKIFEHVEMKMQIRIRPQRIACVVKSRLPICSVGLARAKEGAYHVLGNELDRAASEIGNGSNRRSLQ